MASDAGNAQKVQKVENLKGENLEGENLEVENLENNGQYNLPTICVVGSPYDNNDAIRDNKELDKFK